MSEEIKTMLSTQQKICPTCGIKGKIVDGATVKSMLSLSLRLVRNVTYRFCSTSDCPVVYFSEDGKQLFSTADVREHVYQKEPESSDVLICYCFQHTLGDIRQQVTQSGERTALEDINEGIRTEQCACDWRNPQGTCCLGNVSQFIREMQSQV